MIAVIFEVWPAEGRREAYLNYAARLKPELEKMDGFISVERFQSISDPGKMLSLSIWRDEEAVKKGATTPATAACRRPAATACSPTTACALPP
jgi:heme-degrading monooxygenase HmoA